MPIDFVVLGAGISGTAAALAARAAGARVTVVHAGPGASALAAGGWRGEAPAALLDALGAVGHPLARVDGALPHVNGALDPVDFAPPWHAGALPLADAAVCGIAGLPAFNARYLARAWSAPPLAVLRVELPETPPAGWSPVALAAAVERAPERLGEAVGRRAGEVGAARVILPAVLGLEQAHHSWRAATAAAGVTLVEAVGGTPSIPGWRLDRALRRLLAGAEVRVLEGRAVSASFESASGRRRVTAVRLADGSALPAGAVVLATGKFLAGGITAAPALREPVLRLPVWLDRAGARFHEAAPLLTTELPRSGPQPLLAAGVRTDAVGRPVDERGELLLENVRLAGTVRHGVESGGLGLGTAAADGWRAALSALEAA